MKKKVLTRVLSLIIAFSVSAVMLPSTTLFAEESTETDEGTDEEDEEHSCECDHPGMDQNGNIVSDACVSHVAILDLFKVCEGYTFDADSVSLDKSAKTITFTDFTITETDYHRDNCVANGYNAHQQYDGDAFLPTTWGRVLAVSSNLLDGYTLVFDGNCEFDDIRVCGEALESVIKIKVTPGSTLTLTNWRTSRPATSKVLSLANGTLSDEDITATTGQIVLTGIDVSDAVNEIVDNSTVLDEQNVSVPENSNVVVNGIKTVDNVTQEDYSNYVEALLNQIYELTGLQTTSLCADSMLFDLDASGSGVVKFYVGSRFAGNVVLVSHYHDEVWTLQQCIVNEDGYIYPEFASFSPIGIIVTNQTEKFDIEDTEPTAPSDTDDTDTDEGQNETNPTTTSNANTTKSNSPQTGDIAGLYYLMVLLLGITLVVVGARQAIKAKTK